MSDDVNKANEIKDVFDAFSTYFTGTMPDFDVISEFVHDTMRRLSTEEENIYAALERNIGICTQRRNLCVSFWRELSIQSSGGMYWEDLKSQTRLIYFSGLVVMLYHAGCIELKPCFFFEHLDENKLNHVALQAASYPGVVQCLEPAIRDKVNQLFQEYQVRYKTTGWPPTVQLEVW